MKNRKETSVKKKIMRDEIRFHVYKPIRMQWQPQ